MLAEHLRTEFRGTPLRALFRPQAVEAAGNADRNSERAACTWASLGDMPDARKAHENRTNGPDARTRSRRSPKLSTQDSCVNKSCFGQLLGKAAG